MLLPLLLLVLLVCCRYAAWLVMLRKGFGGGDGGCRGFVVSVVDVLIMGAREKESERVLQ